MPCHSAVISDKSSLRPEDKVSKALDMLKKKKQNYLPIVDENDSLIGYFCAQSLLRNILPVAVDLQTGVQLDTLVGTAPGVAKRLKNAQEAPVYQYCERNVRCVVGETPIWEGLKILIEYGAPLFVVDAENKKYLGTITELSALEELQEIKE